MKRLLFALALLPLGAAAGSIYLCKAYSGGMFWSQAHCSVHNALIDSIVSVPETLPFDQQVKLAQQQRPRPGVSAMQYDNSAMPPSPGVNPQAQCNQLEARARQLDSMARLPQTGASRDSIRRQKDAVAAQRAGVGC